MHGPCSETSSRRATAGGGGLTARRAELDNARLLPHATVASRKPRVRARLPDEHLSPRCTSYQSSRAADEKLATTTTRPNEGAASCVASNSSNTRLGHVTPHLTPAQRG